MYKLVNVYDVEIEGNMIIDAKVDFIATLKDNNDKTIIEAYKKYCNEFSFFRPNGYFMVWELDDNFENAKCINVIFDSDNNEPWVDCVEWDFRVVSSVAANNIGINLIV